MGNNLSNFSNNNDKLEKISDYVQFRNDVQNFKINNCWLLESFYEDEKVSYNHINDENKVKTEKYKRFIPRNSAETDERRNVGIFSTAVCLETIVLYKNELSKSITINDYFDKNHKISFFKFINRGLGHRLHSNDDDECNKEPVTQPNLLSKINTLNRFYLYYMEIISSDNFIKNNNLETEEIYLKKILLEILLEFNDTINKNIETLHPYILYKFLQFIESWHEVIFEIFDIINEYIKACEAGNSSDASILNMIKILELSHADSSSENNKIDIIKGINSTAKGKYKQYFFNKIYLHAKYELYRQMALKLSGDMALYDVKRLIYSLLIVYIDDKFSNNLVREKALNLIFEVPAKEPNALWPTGQLLHISKDSSESITTVECGYDLLEGESTRQLLQSVRKYLPELKNIFHSVMRAAQLDDKKSLKGWYSLSQRDKTPTSWTSALVLLFIKKFCQLISMEILSQAQNRFKMNYRTTNIDWGKLYDNTAVKSKLRLMFDEIKLNSSNAIKLKEKTAMFFGPPGTGKTTLARALATKLGWDYLELTPGDFYSGGESEILPKINDIFYHLKHLKETVVFIDEIDDLVISRDQKIYDPRTLYVNTLLPRFQDIHDDGNIVLIASTNNIDKVDAAISRLGRFDLIIPVGSMSIFGRIDFFANELAKQKHEIRAINKLNPITQTDFINSLLAFIGSTKYYAYSQVKIFITELLKFTISDKSKSVFPSKETIEYIKTKLGFQENKIKLNIDERSVKFKSNDNSKFVKIRPFSAHDIDDINVINYDTEKKVLIDGTDICQITPKLIIKLYVYLHELKTQGNIISNLYKADTKDQNDIIAESIKLIDLLCAKSNKFNDYYYCITTPFFDIIEHLYRREKSPILELSESHKQLLKLIKIRSIT